MTDDYIKKWLKKAGNDFQNSKNELEINKKKKLTDIICFHCQQAVEKYLKAFLISKKVEFKKTHNLDVLLNQCKNIDFDFKNLDINKLTFYAVEIRYPDDFYMPSLDEAKEAFKIAKKIRSLVINKLKNPPKQNLFS